MGVALEVVPVEREKAAHSMHRHSGDDARVVDLNSRHAMLNSQLPRSRKITGQTGDKRTIV